MQADRGMRSGLATNRLSEDLLAAYTAEHESDHPVSEWWMSGHRRVALHNAKLGVTLIFYVSDCISLGRESSTNLDVPHIDLDPYGALELGVSRRHALLTFEDNKLCITDANSANGVRVNQERIRPGVPYPLRDWAVIHLGMMTLELRFPSYGFGMMNSPFSPET